MQRETTTLPSAVCMLVTNIDAPTGGVQKNSRLLLAELNKRGIKTYACVRNYYKLASKETIDGTEFHRSPVVGNSLTVNGVIYLLDTFVWLVRNRNRYDVIHCQQMFGPTMAAAVAGFFTRKPILTRVTTSGHLGEVKYIKEMPLAGLRQSLIRRVAKWVALTSEMKAEIETLDIPPEKVKIIHNSTEIPAMAACDRVAKYDMRSRLGLQYEKVAVFVGRLSKEKNLDVLVDAWRLVTERNPDAHLLLLGEGGDFRNIEQQLRDQVRRLHLENTVHFLGHVPNAKDYLIASDVFVLPTTVEGMSNALVEAFACGIAIVATDIPANREICTDETDSILVPVGEVQSLADSISRVLESSELAEKLGRSARKKAEEDLSIDKMVSRYLEAYEEIDTRPQ